MIFELVSKTHSEPIDRVDLANIGIGGAGTVTAACFLSEFTKKKPTGPP
mgnify:CR=1 FL=1